MTVSVSSKPDVSSSLDAEQQRPFSANEREETAQPSHFHFLLCSPAAVAALALQPDRLDALIRVGGAADDPIVNPVRHSDALQRQL